MQLDTQQEARLEAVRIYINTQGAFPDTKGEYDSINDLTNYILTGKLPETVPE